MATQTSCPAIEVMARRRIKALLLSVEAPLSVRGLLPVRTLPLSVPIEDLAFVEVLEAAFLGALVVAEAAESAAMADAAGGGVVITDFNHQLRPQGHPLEVA